MLRGPPRPKHHPNIIPRIINVTAEDEDNGELRPIYTYKDKLKEKAKEEAAQAAALSIDLKEVEDEFWDDWDDDD